MENGSWEKGTIEILRNSQAELSNPQFNELLMKRIADERNRALKTKFWLNYSLIATSISLIIFLIVRAFIIDPPVNIENYDQAIAGPGLSGYGFFILPLIVLIGFKKLFEARISR